MKTVMTPSYVCEVCGGSYTREEFASDCESLSVSQNKGAKVGDTVLITGGEGSGCMAKITSVGICSSDNPRRYRHTVYVRADLIDHWGSRSLLYDQYELQ